MKIAYVICFIVVFLVNCGYAVKGRNTLVDTKSGKKSEQVIIIKKSEDMQDEQIPVMDSSINQGNSEESDNTDYQSGSEYDEQEYSGSEEEYSGDEEDYSGDEEDYNEDESNENENNQENNENH